MSSFLTRTSRSHPVSLTYLKRDTHFQEKYIGQWPIYSLCTLLRILWAFISRQPIEISGWTKNWLQRYSFLYFVNRFPWQNFEYIRVFFYTKSRKFYFIYSKKGTNHFTCLYFNPRSVIETLTIDFPISDVKELPIAEEFSDSRLTKSFSPPFHRSKLYQNFLSFIYLVNLFYLSQIFASVDYRNYYNILKSNRFEIKINRSISFHEVESLNQRLRTTFILNPNPRF